MKNDNEIADRLDLILNQMFNACQALDPSPNEYLFFKEQNTSNAYWIILLFFNEEKELNQAIKDGTCYQIHEYFWKELNQMEDFKSLNKTIFFEEGKIPEDENNLNKLFAKTTDKLIAMTNGSGTASKETCTICNHDFNNHQMLGAINEELGYPNKGWMTCPEENCNCFRTWSQEVP